MNTLDSANRRVESLFPTPVYVIDFFDLDFCHRAKTEILKIIQAGECFGDDLCLTTNDDLQHKESFAEIKNIILSEIKLVFDNVGVIYDDFYISCMWANVSKPKNRHALHPHANSFFSGVLYLDTPGIPGNIGFKDPRVGSEMLSFDYKNESIFKNRTIEFEPKVGRMIIFPSWLHHGTRPGEFDQAQNRIALSFNILPRVNVQDFSRKISL